MFFLWPICFSVLFFMAVAFFLKRKKPDISIRMRWAVPLFLILTSTLLVLVYLRASGDVDVVFSINQFIRLTLPVSSVIFAVFFLLYRVAEKKRQIIFKTIFSVLSVMLLVDILYSYYSRSTAIYCRPDPIYGFTINNQTPYPNDMIDRLFGLKLQPRFYKDYDDCPANLKCCSSSVSFSQLDKRMTFSAREYLVSQLFPIGSSVDLFKKEMFDRNFKPVTNICDVDGRAVMKNFIAFEGRSETYAPPPFFIAEYDDDNKIVRVSSLPISPMMFVSPQDQGDEKFKRFLSNGNPDAQYAMGRMSMYSDAKNAVDLWRRAAEQGHAEAQHELGKKLLDGDVVPQDYQMAYFWLALSVLQNENASSAKYIVKSKTEAASYLSQEQILSMDQRVKDWQREFQATHPGGLCIAYVSHPAYPPSFSQSPK